jgi:hypothetical protein
MKCLLKYRWVKLPRDRLPAGKGVMGYWAKLAARAAFRAGQAKYCGYKKANLQNLRFRSQMLRRTMHWFGSGLRD